MRALVKHRPIRGATLTDLPVPRIGDKDLLVREKMENQVYLWGDYETI